MAKKLIAVAFHDDDLRGELELLCQNVTSGQVMLKAVGAYLALGSDVEARLKADKPSSHQKLLAIFQAHKTYAVNQKKLSDMKGNRGPEDEMTTDPFVACKFLVPATFTLDSNDIVSGVEMAIGEFAAKFEEVKGYLRVLTHGYEYTWKNEIAPDADVKDLIEEASKTVGKINAGDLKKQILEMEQDCKFTKF